MASTVDRDNQTMIVRRRRTALGVGSLARPTGYYSYSRRSQALVCHNCIGHVSMITPLQPWALPGSVFAPLSAVMFSSTWFLTLAAFVAPPITDFKLPASSADP